jgi:hypothetical protein
MKPRSVEFLMGSRYTIPLWLLAGIWLYLKITPVWESFTPVQQVALAFASCAYGLMILISFIKVFPYERAMHRQGAAGRTPEQIEKQRRRRKPLHLFLAFSGGITGLWWLSEHPLSDNEVSSYALLACFLFAALPPLLLASKLVFRLPSLLRRIRAVVPNKPEKPFIVQWCQPLPKQAASAAQIHAQLPDYCKPLLASAQQQGEKKEAVTPARNPLNAVAGVAAIHS